ncbi:MAG: hypothetical protein NUV46_03720 [Nanoarchaeota archaeon]|nr:hypothetical protein [Nanoarchaeota archaeon]
MSRLVPGHRRPKRKVIDTSMIEEFKWKPEEGPSEEMPLSESLD